MTFFAVKHSGSFISCRFSSFCPLCDLFTPSFRLCSFYVSCMERNRKERSPWLKTKKKNGHKNKKKVFDEGWRKTLA